MMKTRKLPAIALLILAAASGLWLFATCGNVASADDASASPSLESSAAPLLTDTPITEPTAEPTPTVEPSPTAEPTPAPPVDFLDADLPGACAPALEQLLAAWGFQYFPADGKWSADDTYELALFQRWAAVPPTGAFDEATRAKLAEAWAQYGATAIPRTKLPLEGRTVGVNAGHQRKANDQQEPLSPERGSPKRAKVSSGTQGVSTRVPEYAVNLSVALRLQKKLEALGARVRMARTSNNVNISNATRARVMNAAGVDVYLSLHCDGNRNRKIYGLHTLIPGKRGYQTGTALAKSQLFAHIVQQEAVGATGAKNRGFSTRYDLSSLNWSKAPTCLVEMGYMTNTTEDRRLVTAAYQDKLAEGFATAIVRYFEETK